MNTHALAILEFPRLLELVAARASSAPGAERVRALAPRSDIEWLDAEHRRVGAVRALVAADAPWSPEPVPELDEALVRLRVIGSRWTGPELAAAVVLLGSARRTGDALRDDRRPPMIRAVLGVFAERMFSAPQKEEAIHRAVGEDGEVRDFVNEVCRMTRTQFAALVGNVSMVIPLIILERVG